MLYSCTHMSTVGVKGLNIYTFAAAASALKGTEQKLELQEICLSVLRGLSHNESLPWRPQHSTLQLIECTLNIQINYLYVCWLIP